jgi:hypothetical protein
MMPGPKRQTISSQIMVDPFKARGADTKFTIYKGVDHDAWIPDYSETGMLEWFQTKQKNYILGQPF